MSTSNSQALDAIKSFNVQQLNTPVFLEQSGTNGEISDLPLKEPSSQTQAKLFFDIIENIHRDAVKSCLVENRDDDLPDFVRPKKPLPVPYKMQIAIKYTSATHCTVLKYYHCTEKTSLSALDGYIVGKAYLVDIAPSYKVGPIAIQYILTRISNWFLHVGDWNQKRKNPKGRSRRVPSKRALTSFAPRDQEQI